MPELVRLNMKSYGNHNATYDARIEAILPSHIIDNPVDGPYGKLYGGDSSLLSHATAQRWMGMGMEVYGYITGGYEGRGTGGGEPVSFSELEFNKQCIRDMAPYVNGIFIDECSSSPSASGKQYLLALTGLCKSLGLKVWGNTGVDQFSEWFFTEGGFDLMQSSENWRGQSLSAVQQKWGHRISVTGFNRNYTVDDAISLTLDAWDKGLALCYINNVEYVSISPWFEEYAEALRDAGGEEPPEPPEEQVIEDITSEQAFELYGEGVQFIDIRRPSELLDGGSSGVDAEGYIPGMINIDFYAIDFRAQLNALDKTVPYVEYCRTGNRTTQAKTIFEELGFEVVYNMVDGFVTWKAAGYPVGYVAEPPGTDPGEYVTISASQAFSSMDTFAEIMDTRTYAEFATDHLVGATNRTYG